MLALINYTTEWKGQNSACFPGYTSLFQCLLDHVMGLGLGLWVEVIVIFIEPHPESDAGGLCLTPGSTRFHLVPPCHSQLHKIIHAI